MEQFRHVVDIIGMCIDAAGVLAVVIGALLATVRFALGSSTVVADDRFRSYRHELGRAILLGLEFLVAGDIIRTVVVAPTLGNVLVLAVIVLIRTFLSTALQVELEGRLPWQSAVTGR